MTKKRRKGREKPKETKFESLVFPLKKQWLVGWPEVRARKSVMKKSLAAFKAGASASTPSTGSTSG